MGKVPKVRGGLRLDSREALIRGGDLGPAISEREPEKSVLLQAIRFEELEMPPTGRLPANEVEILTRWVKDGAAWSPGSVPVAKKAAPAKSVTESAQIIKARLEWSHRPVVRPAVPSVSQPKWCRSPIDAFILARLDAEGLKPRPRPTA